MPQIQDRPQAAASLSLPTYDSILVHVQHGLTSSHRTELAASIASRFGARLIGMGAAAVEPLAVAEPFAADITVQLYQQMRQQLQADLDSAESAFRRDAAGVEHEWRRAEAEPALAIARAARAADLVATGAEQRGERSIYTQADPIDVVMSAGRPVLIAPAGAAHLQAKKVVVAWKDTREARRAVADALPFLVRAEEVVVQAICPENEVEAATRSASDVAAALSRRGARARSHVVGAPDGSVADELNAEAMAIGADLIVAGAYGHSRAAEWIFGGVTRSLTANPQRYLLLSH